MIVGKMFFRQQAFTPIPPVRRADVFALAVGFNRQAASALKLPVSAHLIGGSS